MSGRKEGLPISTSRRKSAFMFGFKVIHTLTNFLPAIKNIYLIHY